MERSLLTSGKAIVFVALAIMGGYSVLFASDFNFYSRLATAVILTMLVSAVSAVFFLRAMMMAFKPRFIFGDPSSQPSMAGVATNER
jgi:predicted RND superfamily exporter protein